MSVPESLEAKLALFRSKGRAVRRGQQLFAEDSWVAVCLGQGIDPSGHDPVADSLPIDETRRYVHYIGEMVAKTGAAMPTHGDFIEQNCASGT